MELLIKLLSCVNLAGAVHALLQAGVLFGTRRGIRRANKILALFLLALAIGMANGMFWLLGLYDSWPACSILTGSVVLAYGPLFYLYLRAMTDRSRRWRFFDLLHAVPFLLGMLAYASYLCSPPGGPSLPAGFGLAVRSPWLVVLTLSILQTVGYVAAIIRLLRAHAVKVKETYSTIDPVNLDWLRRRLAVYAAIWAVGLALIAVFRLDGLATNLIGQVVGFLMALNTFVTGYRAMLQPEILFGPDEAGSGRRYERSSLTPEKAAFLKSRLLEMMEREKPFLDPEITLPKLARALDVPVAHLSQIINDQLGRNFYEFINRRRVEETKQRLAAPGAGREKLIAVALDCGFNSISTFNRVFKELTGRTPSDYRAHPPLA